MASKPRQGSVLGRLMDRFTHRRKKPRGEKDALTLPVQTRGMQTFSMVAFFVLGSALTWFVVANPFDVAVLRERGSVATTSTSHRETDATAADTVYQCPMPSAGRPGPSRRLSHLWDGSGRSERDPRGERAERIDEVRRARGPFLVCTHGPDVHAG